MQSNRPMAELGPSVTTGEPAEIEAKMGGAASGSTTMILGPSPHAFRAPYFAEEVRLAIVFIQPNDQGGAVYIDQATLTTT